MTKYADADRYDEFGDEIDPAAALLALVRSGDWLNEQEFAPLKWAVPKLIPEGFGLLTGPPKAGKSWAVLDIALAVSAGGVALGKIRTGSPRPVLYLALEDGPRRLQARSRHLLGTVPIPPLLHVVTGVLSAVEVDALIYEWAKRNADERPLIVLDTLGKVMPPALQGETTYARDYRVGGGLKALIDAHPGATLLVVHHIRKAVGGDWMDSTSGTNGLNGAADFTINLARPRNEDRGLIRVTGRDVIEGEYAVSCEDGRWCLIGDGLAGAADAAREARTTEGLGDRAAEIVEFIGEHPEGVRRTQVAARFGISENAASTYLVRLRDGGRVESPKRGLYTPVGCVVLLSNEPPKTPKNPAETTLTTQPTGDIDRGTSAPPACTECGLPLSAVDLDEDHDTHASCDRKSA